MPRRGHLRAEGPSPGGRRGDTRLRRPHPVSSRLSAPPRPNGGARRRCSAAGTAGRGTEGRGRERPSGCLEHTDSCDQFRCICSRVRIMCKTDNIGKLNKAVQQHNWVKEDAKPKGLSEEKLGENKAFHRQVSNCT